MECSLNISFSMNLLVGHNNIKWDKRATSECLPLIYLLLCQRECAISVVWCAQHTVPPQWHFISEPRSLSCLSRFYNHLHPVLQRFHISMKPLQALPRQRWSRWKTVHPVIWPASGFLCTAVTHFTAITSQTSVVNMQPLSLLFRMKIVSAISSSLYCLCKMQPRQARPLMSLPARVCS